MIYKAQGGREKICANCSAYEWHAGSKDKPETMSGFCHMKPFKPGGNRWPPCKGAEWCRDGFKWRDDLKMSKVRDARGKNAGSEEAD